MFGYSACNRSTLAIDMHEYRLWSPSRSEARTQVDPDGGAKSARTADNKLPSNQRLSAPGVAGISVWGANVVGGDVEGAETVASHKDHTFRVVKRSSRGDQGQGEWSAETRGMPTWHDKNHDHPSTTRGNLILQRPDKFIQMRQHRSARRRRGLPTANPNKLSTWGSRNEDRVPALLERLWGNFATRFTSTWKSMCRGRVRMELDSDIAQGIPQTNPFTNTRSMYHVVCQPSNAPPKYTLPNPNINGSDDHPPPAVLATICFREKDGRPFPSPTLKSDITYLRAFQLHRFLQNIYRVGNNQNSHSVGTQTRGLFTSRLMRITITYRGRPVSMED